MSSSGEEDETGPSVDSMDPEERIQARRERINRRIDAAKRYIYSLKCNAWSVILEKVVLKVHCHNL